MRIPNLFRKKNSSGVSRKHFNRRGRRDAEASASPISAGTIETLEGRTMMSVSTDAQGWTVVGPADDSRIIYVSRSAGNDGNSGLSASSAVQTLAKGEALLRNGSADQLLLKRGDTWYESFGGWDKSGRSDDEPMLIGAYGTGAAPLLKTGTANGITTGNTAISHLFIQGIHFNASSRDAGTADYKGSSGGSYGLQALSKLDDLTVEGCEFENYRMNISIQRYFGDMSDVTIRRCVVTNAWSTPTGGHSSGMYVTGVNGLLLEENVFDHNGWNEKAGGSEQTIFNHNVYMRDNLSNVVVRGNVFANASSHGLQARSGGLIKDNLFLDNPIHMSFGLVNGSPGKPGGVTGSVEGNVFLGGRDLNGRAFGWGIELGNLKRDGNTTVRDNIFAHDSQDTTAAIKLHHGNNIDNVSETTGVNDLTIENNVVYRWNRAINGMSDLVPGDWGYKGINDLVVRNNEFISPLSERMVSHAYPYAGGEETWSGNNYFDDSSTSSWFTVDGQAYSFDKWKSAVEPTARKTDPGYNDPTRGAGTYMASIGGTASAGGFLTAAAEIAGGTYNAKYTAAAVINHVRAGFNRASEEVAPLTPDPAPAPAPAPAPQPDPAPDTESNERGAVRIISTRVVRTANGVKAIEFAFSRGVRKSLSLTDFDVFNAETGKRVAKYALSLTYDTTRNTAVLKFRVPLREGAWRANVWSGGVWDASRNNLDGNGDGRDGDHFVTTFTV